jgi:hypothetical protein
VPGTFGLFPLKLSPILIGLPQPGPEPLNVAAPVTTPSISGWIPWMPDRPPAPLAEASQASANAPQAKVGFSDRWLDPTATTLAVSPQPVMGMEPSLSYSASGMLSPDRMSKMPAWPIRDAKAD